MLLSREAIEVAAEANVGPGDFYKPAHGHIYDAMSLLHSQGQPCDPITVCEALGRANLLDSVGGPATLVSLQANTPAASGAAGYARIVVGHALLRRIIGVGAEIVELGYSTPGDIGDALDQVEQMVYELGDAHGDSGEVVAISDLLMDHLSVIERRATGETPPGLMSGLVDFDKITGGLERGGVTTIAGRPGAGKSHAGVALTLNVAERTHRPLLFWSLEMSRTQMADRILANATNLGLDTLRKAQLAEGQWQQLSMGVERVGQLPIWIHVDARASIIGLRARARRMARRLGERPVIVLDYLQLLEGDGRAENRQLEISAIMRGLKRLAIELDTQVVLLAQLNRNLESRADKRPGLADLRESGSVEQDSSVVVMLYRGDMYGDATCPAGTAELIVAKNRDGPTGIARVGYEPATGRYWDLVRF
jgi:replicative DNA helicase